jgi:hypothetical protein
VRGISVAERDELAVIRVVSVRREPLRRMLEDPAYGRAEVRREGFHGHAEYGTPARWVEWFCRTHRGSTPESTVTRIEFEYV